MISVVMPVYNGQRFLAEAIESILKQTYRDFEFIIVNDGSTDDTASILEKYAQQDERIRILNTEHVGLVGALNQGIEAAQYNWIARMDADDVSLPKRFEKQMAAAAARPDVIVWGAYIHHISSSGSVLSISTFGPATPQAFEERRKSNEPVQVIHPTAVMRKDMILKAGGYKKEFEAAEDVELFDRMGDFGLIQAVPEPLLLYRVHPHSISMQKFFRQKQLTEYIIARRTHENAGKQPPTLEEFRKAYEQQPPLVKLKRNMTIYRVMYYRQAGMSFGEKNYIRAAFYFGLSTLLDPNYALRRIWEQSRKLRQLSRSND